MAKWEKKKGVRREAEGRDEGTQSFTAEENRGPWLKWPLSLGSPPAASPPVARFTAIRFLPPLRAFVLSYCLCCCFLRGANVLRLLSLLVRSSTFLSSLVVFDFRFLSVSRPVRFSRLRSLFVRFPSLSPRQPSSSSLSPFGPLWLVPLSSSIQTSIFAQVRNSGYRCNADANTTGHLSP